MEAHNGLDEQYEKLTDEWVQAKGLLTEIFTQALRAKVALLLSNYKYKCALFPPGTPFDESSMENKAKAADDSTNDSQEREVHITIAPGIIRYASTERFGYNRFYSAEKNLKDISSEIMIKAQVLTI